MAFLAVHGTPVLGFEGNQILSAAVVADDLVSCFVNGFRSRSLRSAFLTALRIRQILVVIEDLLALAEDESIPAFDAGNLYVRHPTLLRRKLFRSSEFNIEHSIGRSINESARKRARQLFCQGY